MKRPFLEPNINFNFKDSKMLVNIHDYFIKHASIKVCPNLNCLKLAYTPL